jgi:hypothetical protein
VSNKIVMYCFPDKFFRGPVKETWPLYAQLAIHWHVR